MKRETKKLLIFLGVIFGINLLIGIPRGILVHGGYGVTYGGSLLCCPAAGLALGKVICDKDQRSTMPMYFFTGILVLTAASFLLSLADLFLRSPQIPIIGGYLTAIGFGLLVILFFLAVAYGLPFLIKQRRAPQINAVRVPFLLVSKSSDQAFPLVGSPSTLASSRKNRVMHHSAARHTRI